ncbi:MAG: lipopolysaccharide kinase InaA family protein [Myxococcota bacterium]
MKARATIRWLAGESSWCVAINQARSDLPDVAPIHAGPHRWIEERVLPEKDDARIVLKWYAPRSPALRHARDRLLQRTADAREWRALRALHAADLPVPEPLAWGRTNDGDRVIALRHVGQRPLLERLAEATHEEREALHRALVATVERLHAAGFVHGDLHAGNLRAEDDAILLLDFGRTRRAGGRAAREADLGRLLHSLGEGPEGPAEAARFRAAIGDPERLDRALRVFLADHARGRARRRLREGADWQRLETPDGWHGLGVAERDAAVLLDALLGAKPVETAAPRRDGRVSIERIVVDGADWIRKRVRSGSLRRGWAERGRGSTAARAFRSGQADRLVSDRAARPVAYLERRAAGRVLESRLLMECVGDEDLDAHVPATPAEARRLALLLVDWLVEQHASGLGHRDAKGGNIRLSHGDADALRFHWVDLEDLVGPIRLGEARRIHALVQLNASLADAAFDGPTRREALARYHARLPFSRPLDQVAREIHRKSLARRHRYRGTDA